MADSRSDLWRRGEERGRTWEPYDASVIARSIDVARDTFTRDSDGNLSDYAKGYLHAMNELLSEKEASDG
ncbi:MAG: hypothetical protein OXT70_01105 [Chloroflexota bacterium]|nr:hypothetical protein [Chloroflexota bacterium]